MTTEKIAEWAELSRRGLAMMCDSCKTEGQCGVCSVYRAFAECFSELEKRTNAHADLLALRTDPAGRPWQDGDERCHCTHCMICDSIYPTSTITQHREWCRKRFDAVPALLDEVERLRAAVLVALDKLDVLRLASAENAALLELENLVRYDQSIRRFVRPALDKLDALRAAPKARIVLGGCAEAHCRELASRGNYCWAHQPAPRIDDAEISWTGENGMRCVLLCQMGGQAPVPISELGLRAAGFFRTGGLPSYHELLNKLTAKFGVPGCPTFDEALDWVLQRSKQPYYRGSVTDLATDVAHELTFQQGLELVQELARFLRHEIAKFSGGMQLKVSKS